MIKGLEKDNQHREAAKFSEERYRRKQKKLTFFGNLI